MKNRNYALKLALGIVIASSTILVSTAFAQEDGFDRLVSRWKSERIQLIKRMTRNWLKGQDAAALQTDLLRLSQIESGLATQPEGVLYTAAIEDAGDTQSSAGSVACAYLKEKGIVADSADLFRGKTFVVLTTSSEPVSRQNKERAWGKSVSPATKSSTTTTDSAPRVSNGTTTEIQTVETRYANFE